METPGAGAGRPPSYATVKISLAEWLLTRGKTRLPRSRLRRIAAVQVAPPICDADYILRYSMQELFSL